MAYKISFAVKRNLIQPLVYIYPLPFELSSHLPLHAIPLGCCNDPVGFSETYSKFPLAIYFTHLAWKIPWMEEPGRLQSMGPQRGGHD